MCLHRGLADEESAASSAFGDRARAAPVPRARAGSARRARRGGGLGARPRRTRSIRRRVTDGREQRLTGRDDPDRARRARSARASLSRNPLAPACSASYDVLVKVERGQDQDARRGSPGDEPRVASMPSMHGHADVHQHDVGLERRARARWPRGRRAASPTTSMSGSASRIIRKPVAHERLVVGDERRGSRAPPRREPVLARGTRRPGDGPAASSPPTSATRSRMPDEPVAVAGALCRRRGRRR